MKEKKEHNMYHANHQIF